MFVLTASLFLDAAWTSMEWQFPESILRWIYIRRMNASTWLLVVLLEWLWAWSSIGICVNYWLRASNCIWNFILEQWQYRYYKLMTRNSSLWGGKIQSRSWNYIDLDECNTWSLSCNSVIMVWGTTSLSIEWYELYIQSNCSPFRNFHDSCYRIWT
jgi:hypothetical protein